MTKPTTQSSINDHPYLAVILAGPGEDLFPLINNDNYHNQLHSNNSQSSISPNQSFSFNNSTNQSSTSASALGLIENYQSKSTLPVLNRPIIDLTLDWIEKSNLRDVLILSSEPQRPSLNSVIRSRKSSSNSSLSIRLECVPHQELIRNGTAGTLRWAIERGLIKTAFVVLPCDLYFQAKPSKSSSSFLDRSQSTQLDRIYDRSLLGLVDSHRTNQNLVTSVFYERGANSLDLKDGPSPTLVTLDPRSGILLNLQELDGFGSEIDVRTSMINKFPMTVMSSNLVPAHVFVCSPLVIELLVGLPQFNSFKDQFLPWLIKNQWQPGLLEKIINDPSKTLNTTPDPQALAFLRSTTNPNPSIRPNEPIPRGIRTPMTAGTSTPMTISRNFSYLSIDEQSSRQVGNPGGLGLKNCLELISEEQKKRRVLERNRAGLRCDYVIWRSSDGFVCRGNSVAGYSEINRTALKLDFENRTKNNNNPAKVSLNKTVDGGISSNDSMIGIKSVRLMENSSIKKSVIGNFNQIGKSSKVVNSVLMERVVIGEHVKIENCIICNDVKVFDKVELKDCEVESGTIIESNFVGKGEKIAKC